MDNPTVSLFQGADIKINNSKNMEEEEDLEDQLRRQEEIKNLLQANLDDFNYDDSTINSSTNVSLASNSNLEQLYKDAITPDEQLKVLYEVRCRELQNLKNEYETLKEEKKKEIDYQINQKLLLESEVRQLKISLKNSENLLVDKNATINALNKTVEEKDLHISKLTDLVASHERDLVVYKTENAELHLKVHSQNGPFNLDSKYNSEELKNSLEHKIEKLENALEAETRKFEVCNKEHQALQDEIQRLVSEKISLENDNNALLRNLDAAQLQCKDLIDVIEVLKHENEHYQGRVNEMYLMKDSPSLDNSGGHNSSQSEKLRKMLVDKSVEIDSCKAKLKSYESTLKELNEYRQLKSDVLKKEFQQCDNQSHTRDLILLQNELHNYQRLIEEKNRQISELHSNNKDLKEKIEEMLVQTRTEIQNISSKYNVPQLEIMKQELEKSGYNIQILSRKLEESEEKRLSLFKKLEIQANKVNNDGLVYELERCRSDLMAVNKFLASEREQNRQLHSELEAKKDDVLQLQTQLNQLKQNSYKNVTPDNDTVKNDYEALKLQLKNVMDHLERKSGHNRSDTVLKLSNQMNKFLEDIQGESIEKGLLEEKIHSWEKMLGDIEIECHPDEALKAHYKEAVKSLHEYEERIREMEEAIQDLKNAVTIGEGEKCSLTVELENGRKVQIGLEKSIEELKLAFNSQEEELKKLKEQASASQPLEMERALQSLREEMKIKEGNCIEMQEMITRLEQDKKESKRWLEKVKKDIDKLKSENTRLVQELKKTEADKLNDKHEENKEIDKEIINYELQLRNEIELEYQNRIDNIEKMYKKSFKETTDLCKQQKLELDAQDKKFREYLKVILTECESCTLKLEREKLELTGQVELLKADLAKCKSNVEALDQKYLLVLRKLEKESLKSNEEWKAYSKRVVCSCLDIEATNKKVRDRVLASMDRYDREVESIQAAIESKLTRKSKKGKALEA